MDDALNKFGLFMYDYRDNLCNDKYMQISENGKYLNIVNLETGVYKLCKLDDCYTDITIVVTQKENINIINNNNDKQKHENTKDNDNNNKEENEEGNEDSATNDLLFYERCCFKKKNDKKLQIVEIKGNRKNGYTIQCDGINQNTRIHVLFCHFVPRFPDLKHFKLNSEYINQENKNSNVFMFNPVTSRYLKHTKISEEYRYVYS